MRKGWYLLVFLLVVGLAFSQEEAPVGEEVPEIAVAIEVEAEKEKPAKVDEVPLEKIEKMVNLRSVPEVLKRLPGTETYYGPGLAASMPVVRGNDTKWTQILLEGAILSPIGRPQMLNMMPLTGIESIEVIKGPAPPQYPGSTIGGLVLLKMKSGDKYPGAGARLTLGSYDRQTYELWSGGGNEEKNYFIAVNKEYYSGWEPHQKKNFTEASFKLNFTPEEKSKLTIVGTSLTGILWGLMQTGPNPVNTWLPEWTIDHRALSSVTYSKQVSEKSDYFLRFVPFSFSGEQKIQTMQGPALMPWRYALWKTEYQYNLRPNPNSIWVFGLGYEKDTLKSPGQITYKDIINKYGGSIPASLWQKHDLTYNWAFVQNTFTPSEGKAYTLALRYDNADPGKTIYSPFLSAHFSLNPTSTLRLAITKNRRFADLHELYGEGIFKGNTDLRPETGWTYQLDWERSLANSAKLDLTIYHTKLDNVIGADASTKNQYYNIGRARLRGIEMQYEKGMRNGSWWASYTYLDAKDLVNNRDLVLVFRTASPKNMFKTGFTLNGKNGTSYDLELFAYGPRSTDGKKVTLPAGSPWGTGDNIPPDKVGGYAIVNFKIKKIVGQDGELAFSVENLFDKEYEDLLYYPAPGRWINLSYSLKF
jgi:outer membrane cobalamin receptor